MSVQIRNSESSEKYTYAGNLLESSHSPTTKMPFPNIHSIYSSISIALSLSFDTEGAGTEGT